LNSNFSEATTDKIIEFGERLEIVESWPGTGHTHKKAKMANGKENPEQDRLPDGAFTPVKGKYAKKYNNYNNIKKIGTGQRDKQAYTTRMEAPKVCPLHGPGHDANSCKVLQNQAEKMKASYKTKNFGQHSPKKRPFKNNNFNSQEINAMVASSVAKAVK